MVHLCRRRAPIYVANARHFAGNAAGRPPAGGWQGYCVRPKLTTMRPLPLRLLTWGTIAAALLSAVWLATFAPLRPFGAAPFEAQADIDLPPAAGASPQAGQAASSPDAMASAHGIGARDVQ